MGKRAPGGPRQSWHYCSPPQHNRWCLSLHPPLVLLLVLLVPGSQGAAAAPGAQAAAGLLCSHDCAADVAAVCGADGRSYSNECVAACAGVQVASQGYCPGDKVRFVAHEPQQQQQQHQHVSSSSSSRMLQWGQPAQQQTAPPRAVISPAVINRFAAEGYVYQGKVELSALANPRTGYQQKHEAARLRKEHSAMFQQLPTGTAAWTVAAATTAAPAAGGSKAVGVPAAKTLVASAASTDKTQLGAMLPAIGSSSAAAAAPGITTTVGSRSSSSSTTSSSRSAAAAADETQTSPPTPAPPAGARLPAQATSTANGGGAAAAQQPPPTESSSSGGTLDVAIVRVDSAGNLYTKTYTYDNRKYNQMAYPPFNPSGATLVETKLQQPRTPAASAAAGAKQQQQGTSSSAPAPAPARTAAPAGVATETSSKAATKTGSAPASSARTPSTSTVPNPAARVAAPDSPLSSTISGSSKLATAPGASSSKQQQPASSSSSLTPGAGGAGAGALSPNERKASGSSSGSAAGTGNSKLVPPSSSSAASSSSGGAAPGGDAASAGGAADDQIISTTGQQQQPRVEQGQQQQLAATVAPQLTAPPAAAVADAVAATPTLQPALQQPLQQIAPLKELEGSVPQPAAVNDNVVGAAAKIDKQLLAGNSEQQQLLQHQLAAPATAPGGGGQKPDYFKTARQGVDAFSRTGEVVRRIANNVGGGRATQPVQQVGQELIPEMGSVDAGKSEADSSSSSSGDAAAAPAAAARKGTSSGSSSSKSASPGASGGAPIPAPAADVVAAPVQQPSLEMENAQVVQQGRNKGTAAPPPQQQQQKKKMVMPPAAQKGETDDEDWSDGVDDPQDTWPVHKNTNNNKNGAQASPPPPASAPTAPKTPATPPAQPPASAPAPAPAKQQPVAATPAEKQQPQTPAAAAPATPPPAAQKPSTPAPAPAAATPPAAAVPAAGKAPAPTAAVPAPAPAAAPVPVATTPPKPAPDSSDTGGSSGSSKVPPATAQPPAPAKPQQPPPKADSPPAAAVPPPVADTPKQEQQQQQQEQVAPKQPPPAVAVPQPPAQPPKQLPPCDANGQFCRNKIMGTSTLFGTHPKGGRYMDQSWLVSRGHTISGVQMFYNSSSGCLRGLQLTYTHPSPTQHATTAATALTAEGESEGGEATAAAASGDSGSSGVVVQLLGSAYKHPSVVVKELKLKEGEIIGKAEIWDPKCIKYLRLFTNKGRKLTVGQIGVSAVGQARNVTKNRNNGLLVAVKGWQDPPKQYAATAKKPAGVSPGVLKQLQFVWGAPHCDNKCSSSSDAPVRAVVTELDAHPATTAAAAAAVLTGAHRHLLMQEEGPQEQPLDAGSSSSSIERRLQAQQQLQEGQARRRLAAAAATTESHMPALVSPHSNSSDADGAVVVPASIHRILSVIKPDDRLPCPVKSFPYYAMGQIKAKASDGGFVCSGGLIGSNRVLTAGHCVWDDRNAQGAFKDLRFAPGQWKEGAKVSSPFGFVDWDYVTLFDSYINDPDGEGLAYDVAVITLSKPVGTELGWLGIKAEPTPCRATPLTLSLAGYPGDDPENPRVGGWAGGCYYDKCDVTYSCGVSITNHTCDSFVGQSGAPMYDEDNFVRAVHTLGVLPGFSTTNGAITIQKFLLDNIMGYWRDTDGYTQTRAGAAGGAGGGAGGSQDGSGSATKQQGTGGGGRGRR